ncbi:LysE family translocator [Pseudoroseicyclus tamaricis]|uniref:LysE family translocator n=1 Tax=Pseudoroseicyclus tamaricis TaxID=2705421 RepID=A0A6B2JGR1_9RHOB|nr:LysE family translocator [Pseudoroseicyclus tamaricis]NDV00353.1 LysE family translocator [Pseudoroseicyclus tamaricis]
MMADSTIPLLLFALAGTCSPGPNNLMLMASGANYGFRRTLPHMLGVGLGFSLMIFGVGIGLSLVFERWPWVQTVLTAASLCYLLWLAWKIASAVPPADGPRAEGRPLTFLQAAGFQWVNPKAWAMATTATTVFAAGHGLRDVLVVSGAFLLVSIVSTTSWSALGVGAAQVLTDRRRLRAFNIAMAVLLLATLVPLIWP